MSKKLPSKTEAVVSGVIFAAAAATSSFVTLPMAGGVWVVYLGWRTYKKLRKVRV